MEKYEKFDPLLRQRKEKLREEYKERRRLLSPSEISLRDREICRYGIQSASFRFADAVLMYDAIPGEINITDIALYALEKGKTVAYPRCDRDTHTMTYRTVNCLGELKADSYGIREPSPNAEIFSLDDFSGNAVCFVPALSFDFEGYRLGYGKGYYDRFLGKCNISTLGVVYSDFISESVPRGRFDIKVGALLTEKGIKKTVIK